MKCSNNFLNFIIYIPLIILILFSFANSFSAICINKTSSCCVNFLDYPLIIACMSPLFLLSGLALYGSDRGSWLYWLCLLLMFLLVIVLLGFIIFAFVVTNKGDGHVVSNRGYKEYRLVDYSHWFQKRVLDSKTWESIKSCLLYSKVCQELSVSDTAQDVFFKRYLSPTQSGCCKPPENCGFLYISPTNWNKTHSSTNPDCNAWRNNPNTLCYDCNSCKAGFVHDIKSVWRKWAVVHAVFLGVLIIPYSIICCALYINRWKNAKSEIQGSQMVELLRLALQV